MKFRKRAVAVCIESDAILCVLLKDPVTGAQYWVPPGGGIEDGEAPAVAAEREMLEEAGLRVNADTRTHLIETYPFYWAGVHYMTENHYFIVRRSIELAAPGLAPTLGPEFVREPYILAEKWVKIDEALAGFKTINVQGYRGEIYAAVVKVMKMDLTTAPCEKSAVVQS